MLFAESLALIGQSTDGGQTEQGLTAVENGGGMSVVYNYPNMTGTLEFGESPEFGHVVAPKADLIVSGGNYNGSMVVNSMYSNGEGHMWPYKGGKLVPSTVGLIVHKTVDGEEPTAEQVYNFKLEELQQGGTWSLVEEKHNVGGNISFTEINYTSASTHWYRLYEDTTGVQGEPDTTWYVLKVVVTAHEDGGDTTLTQETTAYKVIDKEDLLVDGEINLDAITEVGEGETRGDADNITFINEEQKGSLTISKTVVSPIPAEETKAFTFTIELSDKTVNGKFSGVSFTNGQATVTVAGGSSKTIEGLPVGVTYTVTEAVDNDFTTTAEGATGTIVKEETKTAAFTNTRKTGKVTISKSVVSPVPAEETKEFTFTIELSDKTVSGTFSGVSFTNGQATVTVAGGSSKTIEGLPAGVTYTVTETVDNDFTADKTEATGEITAAGTTAAFKNTRKTGDLEVTKTVVSSTASDKQKDFSFKVTLDPKLSGEFGGMEFTNGEATFTLKDGGKMTASGLPVGCTYEVSEETAAGFVTTKTGETGTISATKATAAFTRPQRRSRTRRTKAACS